MEIRIDTNLDEQLVKANELIKKLDEVAQKSEMIQFLTIKKFANSTGWALCTVQALFNRNDFPACDFGREKVAEVNAVREYFSVRREKE